MFEAPTREAGIWYYYCVVTNTNEQADGKKTAQTVSKAVSVMVTEPRQITVDAAKPVVEWISGGGAFNQGDPAVLEIKASVEDGGTLSYQWYRSEDGSAESGTAKYVPSFHRCGRDRLLLLRGDQYQRAGRRGKDGAGSQRSGAGNGGREGG